MGRNKKRYTTVVRVMVAVVLISVLWISLADIPQIQAASPPRADGAYYNYGEALQKSIMFYKANRLGDLPDNYILPWRADAAMTDGADVGLDLTGGWADAGDGVKFGHPMAYAAAQLAWGVYEWRSAYEQSGQLDDILDEIKWATDYFIKAHPSPNVFYYDCGYGESDHSVWVPHELLEYLTERTSFKVDTSTPGSDVAGMTAAALALASIIFEPTDPAYAATCLTHATQLFSFADTYRGKNPLDNFYQSGGYLDDLTWAAVWLYLKTNDSTYLDKALSYIPITSLGGHHTHCWDDVSYGAALKLAQITKDAAYAQMVETNLDWWMPNGGLTYTPGGLAWLSDWGSLRYASTAAFLAFVWADDTSVGTASKKQAYREFAERQINYCLGDNPRNGSFVVGFGTNAPHHPHHRTAHGSWLSMPSVPSFHRHILYGALVGGPGSDEKYADDVADYTHNEVACDYEAGFVGSVAKMYSLYGGAPLVNWPQPGDFRPPEDNLTEYFVRGWIVYEGYGVLQLLFQANNRSSWPPAMKDKLSCRYFMDLTEVLDAGLTASDIKITLGVNEGCTLLPLRQWSGNIYYFTLDFTGTQLLPAEWQKCEKDANVEIKYPSTTVGSSTTIIGSNANDWSYQNLTGPPDYDAKSFAGKTPYIPIYDNGVLLWGEEPLGGNVTPTPIRVITPTPTRRIVTTATPTPTVRATPTPTRGRIVTATPTRRVRTTPTRRVTPTQRVTPTRRGVTPTSTRRVTPTPTQRSVVTATPTRGTGNYIVNYAFQSDWGNGATVNVTITNGTTTAVNGWTLAWTFPGNQTITNLWNGSFTQSGASVSVRDGEFNANIPVNGGTATFGFNINYSGTNAKPTSFTLNGTACQVQ